MAESAIVFDTATTTAGVSNARTLESHHLSSGALSFTLDAYHMAPAGSAVSRVITLQSHHLLTVGNSRSLTAYHMAGAPSPITPSGDTSVSRSFSIPVFDFGEDLGGTIDFTVE